MSFTINLLVEASLYKANPFPLGDVMFCGAEIVTAIIFPFFIYFLSSSSTFSITSSMSVKPSFGFGG
jgi:hypothetical protein